MNKYIDHTILKATTTKEQIKAICEEAIKYNFKSVCINPYYVSYAKELLKNTEVLVCTVIGFPLGATTTKTKGFETKTAIEDGADEIDMVINIGALIDNQYEIVQKDIEEVVKNAKNKTVKVIIETCYLNDEQKIKACELAKNAKANFVKTSTGFGTGGATVEDVGLMKSIVLDELEVKASGGVRNIKDCQAMINAGATRIGTSNGIDIVNLKEAQNNY